MPRCRKRLIFLSTLLLSLLFISSAAATGLSTTFGEVKVEHLSLGQVYSLKEEADFPLELINTSEKTLQLKIEVLIPQSQDLIEPYQALPDASWIKLEQDEFEIKPGEAVSSDVTISIPDDKQYLGKKYQVYLWSHTTGETLGIGLRSRLLLEIEKELNE